MFVYENNSLFTPQYIINLPTKRHWREKSYLKDVELGIQNMAAKIIHYGIKTVAIPPLGCGLGGLDWRDVRKLLEIHFAKFPDVVAIVLEPDERIY